jgi:hypothetical protein
MNLLLTAETSTVPSSIQAAGGWLFAALVGVGGVSVLVSLLLRGIWSKNGDPMVRQALASWYNSKEQMEARRKEIKEVLAEANLSPEVHAAHATLVGEIIDNHLRRDDGLIRKEITVTAQRLDADLTGKIASASQGLKDLLMQMIDRLDRFDARQQTFQEQTFNRLGRIEGTLSGPSSKGPTRLPGG